MAQTNTKKRSVFTAPAEGRILELRMTESAAVKKNQVVMEFGDGELVYHLLAPKDGTVRIIADTKHTYRIGDPLFAVEFA